MCIKFSRCVRCTYSTICTLQGERGVPDVPDVVAPAVVSSKVGDIGSLFWKKSPQYLFEMCCFHMGIASEGGGWCKGLPGWFGALFSTFGF